MKKCNVAIGATEERFSLSFSAMKSGVLKIKLLGQNLDKKSPSKLLTVVRGFPLVPEFKAFARGSARLIK